MIACMVLLHSARRHRPRPAPTPAARVRYLLLPPFPPKRHVTPTSPLQLPLRRVLTLQSWPSTPGRVRLAQRSQSPDRSETPPVDVAPPRLVSRRTEKAEVLGCVHVMGAYLTHDTAVRCGRRLDGSPSSL
ncbi:hypothetical protein BDA96_04G099400 [Sorghum bicolor]|uniref:Uncharacterized protein n=1 Tax=Sorghum bicolor TaxID=4558 RepID=A0A921UJP6_SORBI|nr:hypothetical protein BDA96_04G099400 [Sorghum bicolor]